MTNTITVIHRNTTTMKMNVTKLCLINGFSSVYSEFLKISFLTVRSSSKRPRTKSGLTSFISAINSIFSYTIARKAGSATSSSENYFIYYNSRTSRIILSIVPLRNTCTKNSNIKADAAAEFTFFISFSTVSYCISFGS